jgi:hypothetical protein
MWDWDLLYYVTFFNAQIKPSRLLLMNVFYLSFSFFFSSRIPLFKAE